MSLSRWSKERPMQEVFIIGSKETLMSQEIILKSIICSQWKKKQCNEISITTDISPWTDDNKNV